ncbi:MAG: S9 family peptidase [Propionibacteriaceae bacterium]
MTITAPYGSWISPITVDMMTAGSTGLSSGIIDENSYYWTQSRSSEGGRISLWRQDLDGSRIELTPDSFVRNMVHEYGGGPSWTASKGIVIYSTFPSHEVKVISEGITRTLVSHSQLRFSSFQIDHDRGIVIAIREDHRESDIDCCNQIVALDLHSDNPDGGTVIASGADFYSCPQLSPAGQLAWIEWNHPNMPWDITHLMCARLTSDLKLTDVTTIAGQRNTSAPAAPVWHGEDLIFLDDPDGYWNFFSYRNGFIKSLHQTTDPHDYILPQWVPENEYHVLTDGRIICHRMVDGADVLGILADGIFSPFNHDSVCQTFTGNGSRIIGTFSYPDRFTELAVIDVDTLETTILATSSDLSKELRPYLSIAQPFSWQSPLGAVHAHYYQPTNPDYVGVEDELPPLKVLSHGGPTGFSYGTLNLAKQYWTSRGWAVLDINYGGSGGYGRAYRDRLTKQWGMVDVNDCVDGARAVIAQGLADPARIAIEGGSAGGYTTLAALTSSNVFAAGNSLYGIADLISLASDTHKFESRYLHGLLGGTPEEVPDIYHDRSPINHLDRLSCPMLIQQGSQDRVVPPNQATQMADAVRAQGLPVALLMFEGEGHGFRQAENIRASIEGANSFFGQVFGYQPADIPALNIDNLS